MWSIPDEEFVGYYGIRHLGHLKGDGDGED